MWFLLLAIVQFFPWKANAETMVLGVGERKKIAVQGELLIGPEKVVAAKDLGSHFQIEALKAGFTLVKNGTKTIEISVLKKTQTDTVEVLKKEASSTLGLEVLVNRGEVVLSGKVLSFGDWERIAKACSLKKCDYVSRFDAHPSLRKRLQRELGNRLQNLGYGAFRMRWEPQVQMLVPERQKISKTLQNVVSSYGIEVLEDPTPIEIEPSIRVQITILEVKKSETMKYGVKWPEEYTARLLPQDGAVNELLVNLRLLETKGIGRILANPSLLCRSGKESEFLAGGEIPIKIMNEIRQDVVWKKYGILLKLKPLADFSGRMSLAVETEISSIDPGHTVDGIPGFFTNRVQSHFDLTEPRTIVLWGLLKKQDGDSSQGLIGLSSLPVIGSLFSSRDFLEDKSELVILVRPELVSSQGEE